MQFCNILSGSGFDLGFFGGWSMALLGLVLLAFIIMFARKWISEEAGLPFNWIFGAIGAGLAYLIVISITCSFKWAFLIGLIGMIIGGFLVGMFIGDGGEY